MEEKLSGRSHGYATVRDDYWPKLKRSRDQTVQVPSLAGALAPKSNCGTVKIEGGIFSGFRRDITVPSCGTVETNGTQFGNGDTGIEMRSPDQYAQSPIINNAPSINTFNQSGGNNIINLEPQRLTFDLAICEQLMSKLPTGKRIQLESLGSASDQKVADQYQHCLEDHGFTVQRAFVGMMVPPPDHKITLGDPNASPMRVIIAPSAQ